MTSGSNSLIANLETSAIKHRLSLGRKAVSRGRIRTYGQVIKRLELGDLQDVITRPNLISFNIISCYICFTIPNSF
jgi:hypothetical protein